MKIIIDIETNNLLDKGLDYTSLPYKLKEDYKLWCIVFRTIDGDRVASLKLDECTTDNIKKYLKNCTVLAGHNIVNFDLPVLKLLGLLEYTVGYPGLPDTLFGKPVLIHDTLIWSKLLNPDRYNGHSLEAWGKRLGNYKGDFTEFSKYSEEMLTYCIQDTSTNRSLYFKLEEERGSYKGWDKAYELEKKLVDLTLRQSVFGFELDQELAKKNLEILECLLKERADRVDPILPKKKLNKGETKDFTPPIKQINSDGSCSALLRKFAIKHNAELDEDNRTFTYKGKVFSIPLTEPIETHRESTIEDIDNLKGYLLKLGWTPTEVKERDLVKDIKTKRAKPYEKIVETIDRYVKQTETSEFRELRLEALGVPFEGLRDHLINKIDGGKPIYVPGSPKLQVGVDKDICPALVRMGKQAEFVKDACEYYTYRHRRNSIAGGNIDEDTGEPEKGFLSYVRPEDGRIATPADTLGCNTFRYKHKVVCNIPRVSSLFGKEMRSMFACGKDFYQLGFDFASLEARIQGHYCIPYKNGVEYAKELVAEKPNDVHSRTAQRLSIDRDSAKSINYGITFGAQAAKIAKMLGIPATKARKLFNEYWNTNTALKELRDNLIKHWESNDKKWVKGLDGRKLMTRSKHSLINIICQSGGAIVTKLSLVRIAQILESKGLLGDPFTNTKEDVKVWQMIVNHDEAQYAVHKSLINIKLFKDEDTAKKALEPLCSAVGKSSKGYYRGYCTEPVEVISEGIKRASKELDLKVDMGFEWIPGSNWGQCH